MKLFLIAALIAISSAARLEHLEYQQQLRAYLPPHQAGFGAPQGSNAFVNPAFPSASNQYLPPDHGPSAAAGVGQPQFAGSIHGFGVAPAQQLSPQDAAPQGSSPFGAQASYQPQGVSNQYLAPHVHSSQNAPQQPFDEQTGYHY